MTLLPTQKNFTEQESVPQRTMLPGSGNRLKAKNYLFAVPFTCMLLLLPPSPTAADEKRTLSIGDIAPEWTDLPGTDDQQHSLTDLQDADVVVVCFTCNTCPYSVDYEQRLIALQKKYADSNAAVQVIAINSNTVPGDRMDAMKERATNQKFNFTYLSDGTQKVALAFGAIYTPEFFVLNKERWLIYKGAMDDETDASKVKVQYVDLAVQAALRGELPEVTQKGARGCAIRFKRQRK